MDLHINLYNKKGQKQGWWIDYYRNKDPETQRWFVDFNKPYTKELFENGKRVFYKHFSYDGRLTFEKLNIY